MYFLFYLCARFYIRIILNDGHGQSIKKILSLWRLPQLMRLGRMDHPHFFVFISKIGNPLTFLVKTWYIIFSLNGWLVKRYRLVTKNRIAPCHSFLGLAAQAEGVAQSRVTLTTHWLTAMIKAPTCRAPLTAIDNR